LQLALNAGSSFLRDDAPESCNHCACGDFAQQEGAARQTPPGPQSASVLQLLMAQLHRQAPLSLGGAALALACGASGTVKTLFS